MQEAPQTQLEIGESALDYPAEINRLFPLACGVLFFGNLIWIAMVVAVAPEQLPTVRAISPVMDMLLAAWAWYLHRRGRFQHAVRLLLLGFWGLVGVASWFDAGLHSLSLYFYPLIIIGVSWQIGIRAAFVLASLSTLVMIGFAVAEVAGILPYVPPAPPIMPLIIAVISIWLAAFGIRLFVEPHRRRYLAVVELTAALEKRLRDEEAIVAERTRDLALAKAAAEAANHAKSAFLANMSHELRTPLNAILGFSELLGQDSAATPEQQQTLAIIHKSGDHLLSLINDVLDIAKIEAGEISVKAERFELGSMVSDIIDMLDPRAKAKGLQLTREISPKLPRHMVGDQAKLRQILINLISNAIKATEQGGVSLRVDMPHNHAGRVLLEVEDSGCGIAAEDLGKIMQAFVQVGSQDQQQGTGLGLSISRKFAEMMGGSLTAVSTLGQGSTFRLELPLQAMEPEAIPAVPMVSGTVSGLAAGQLPCRVLAVDDEEHNLQLMQRLLGDIGLEVRLAADGAEALAQFQIWQPHFILMDRRMPVMDGVEATRAIRALPGGAEVRIVAVTASTFREEIDNMLAAGFDDVVCKPFRAGQLFDCMERLLGWRFLREEVEAEPVSSVLCAEALATLPAALLHQLREALVLLEQQGIQETVAAIAPLAPELAAALGEMTRKFDYAPILALLQELESG